MSRQRSPVTEKPEAYHQYLDLGPGILSVVKPHRDEYADALYIKKVRELGGYPRLEINYVR